MSTVTYPQTFGSLIDAASAGQATWAGVCPSCGATHTLAIRSAVPTPEGNVDVETDPCPTPLRHILRRRTST